MPTSVDKKMNPDILKERRAANFDVEEFAIWWHGGADKLKIKREIEKTVFDDPELEDKVPRTYSSYQDMYDLTIEKTVLYANKLKQIQKEQNPGGNNIFPYMLSSGTSAALYPQGNPLLLHLSMFIEAIRNQGTPEQITKWLPRAENCAILGTYAQTELGHGTFLRGLETRADYDAKTDEFVLHSPTITAYKWWPGGLGHTANYAVVAAQLYINDQPKGIQMFMVQLRDEETHMPLEGITIGEIGNKLSFQTANNGYLGFNKFRIPRTNMLMKNAQVLPNGTFNKSPASVLTYFTMVQVRVSIVVYAAHLLARAAVIATRYSAVRRQSVINPKEAECQIMDHLTQQMKVFPQIAKGVVFKLSSGSLLLMLSEVQKDLMRGDLERLPEMHALSSCIKAIATKDGTDGVQTLRLACGGHGFLLASNLPDIYGLITAPMTYEGENTVLLLQTARYLMKAWAQALDGKKLVPTVAYFSEYARSNRPPKWNGSWGSIIKGLQFVTANKVRIAFNHIEERKKKQNVTHEEAVNLTSIELASAAEMHGRVFLAQTAVQQVQNSHVSGSLKAVLNDLMELYLVNECLNSMRDILRFFSLTEGDICDLQSRLEKVLAKIRPNAVAIVDGFDYHDRVLSSALGSYDGNAYERIFASAQQSPMNQIQVQKSFHEHLKHFMKSNM